MDTRIVFMGSPDFALPALCTLAEHYPVVGVVTQPDRPAGRGRTLTPPPVKILAQELGIPLVQPNRLREPEAMAQLRTWNPDLIVVAAFGQILRQEVLNLPPFGCINVHGSLLPRWRGAAPIQAAMLNGDTETGITIMRMDAGVDTGPFYSQASLSILPEDTAGLLSLRMAELGAKLLLETLPGCLSGALQPQEQNHELATYAPMLKKEQGELDFNQPAEWLSLRVRAFNPWPGAFTTWQNQLLKISRAHVAPASAVQPGRRVICRGFPAIECGQGLLVLDEVQPAGKKNMPGNSFLQGARNWETAV